MRGPIPFGRHLLLERIAVGGMAEVFRAKSFGVEGFERIVAVKKILASMAEDEEFIKMFIDEARIASYLTHQNIVQIYELGKHETVYFISMEYVAGRDLRTILDRCKRLKRPMDPPMACYIIGRVCEALDYAHRKRDPTGKEYRIIHRDVSPQNVIISYEGEVKLCDFGIAKAVTQSTRTQVGVLKGKFAYMSPEQVRGRAIDRRSDLFALGVIFYEMLTGERLFLGDSDYSTLEAVRAARVPAPRSFNPALPERLEEVLLKMLTREPEQRYQWASEVLEDLHSYLVSAGQVFHAHNLRQFMQDAYEREIGSENGKLEAFMSLKLPDVEEPRAQRQDILEVLPVNGAPPRRDTSETAQQGAVAAALAEAPFDAPSDELEVSGTAIDPGAIEEAALSRSTSDEPPLVSPARSQERPLDDLSATLMSDEDEPPSRRPVTLRQTSTIADVDARREGGLQAEIQAAQAALLQRLEALKDADTLHGSIQDGGDRASMPRVVSSAAATHLDFAAPADDRPIEDPAEDEAGRTSEWVPPLLDDPEPEAMLRPSEPPKGSTPSAVRQIREKKRDSDAAAISPDEPRGATPSFQPVRDSAVVETADRTPPPRVVPRVSEPPVAQVPPTAPLLPAATGFRDPRSVLAIAGVAVLLTLTLLIGIVLAQRPATATLHLETTPVTAVEVRLDGELVATDTPVDLENLTIGEHTIEVRAKGFQTYRQTFPISELRPHTLTIPLKPEVPAERVDGRGRGS